MRVPFLALVALGIATLASVDAKAAADPVVEEDYARASYIQNNEKNRYYLNRLIIPNWFQSDQKFWFRLETTEGFRFVEVDARTGKQSELFDHRHLANVLSAKTKIAITEDRLPLLQLKVLGRGEFEFHVFDMAYRYTDGGALQPVGSAADRAGQAFSPDGGSSVFLKNHNLWVRNAATGEQRPLTTDGKALNSYGSQPAMNPVPGPVEALWSPNSKYVLTIQTDEREVTPVPIVEYAPEQQARPILREFPQAHPGDKHVPQFRPVVIDVASGREVPIQAGALPSVRMLDAPVTGGRVWWSQDSTKAYVVHVPRGEQQVSLIEIDTASGLTRAVFTETASHGSIELGQTVYLPATIAPLPKSDQVIWYSERSGWPHLYLYDLKTGDLVRQLTSGEWVVRDILSVDETARNVLVSVSGRDADKNPYYREVGLLSIDTGELRIVSSGDEDRRVLGPATYEILKEQVQFGADPKSLRGVSPDGAYFIETRTRVDRPSVSVIRKRTGEQVAEIAVTKVRSLPEGFRWPEPVMVMAADNATPIYGLVARPTDFSPDKKYPVIDYIYGGPQVSYVPTSFDQFAADAQSLAELGFIVVMLDGRGTAGRSRDFRQASYGAIETASNLADHVAGIRQLAAQRPYMDVDRVGITGFSGGGYMTARAMLTYSDFFDVGVAMSGNHDQRIFVHGWGERYQGLPASVDYTDQANPTHAAGLTGKLLIMHGMLDYGVHPAAAFQLVQALVEENKPFDMLFLPRAGHQLTGYGLRRQWDYFVEHLSGVTPPRDGAVTSAQDSQVEFARYLRIGR